MTTPTDDNRDLLTVVAYMRAAEGSETTERRTHHEPDAERCAEHAHEAGTVGRRSDVGHSGLSNREAGARTAIDDTTEEEHPEGTRSAGDETAHRRAEQRDDDHRLAPDSVAEAAEHRRHHELGERETGEEEPHRETRRTEPFGVARQDGHHDAETDQVEGDRGPDGPVALGHRHPLTTTLRHSHPVYRRLPCCP